MAESIIFGEITSGASNDIERATKIARKMVCELGMSDNIGPCILPKADNRYSWVVISVPETTFQKIPQEESMPRLSRSSTGVIRRLPKF